MLQFLIFQLFWFATNAEGPGGRCDSTYGPCNVGRCCSLSGWCGSTESHCYLPSCQQQYTPQPCLSYSKPISVDGRCSTNGATCGMSRCCSKYGWCGTSDSHCLDGCQIDFGKCGASATVSSTSVSPSNTALTAPSSTTENRLVTTTSTTTSTLPISTDGFCGANYGTRCPTDQCCSDYAKCGITIESCGWTFWACRPAYGKCGGSILDPPKNSYPAVDYSMQKPMFTSCIKPGLFALTFDDGIWKYTTELLDILDSNNLKATFFINAYKTGDITVEPYRSVMQRMYSSGHHIASHTYDHFDLATLNVDEVWAQMYKNDVAFKQVIGKRPIYMRPPFGSLSSSSNAAIWSWGYKIVWRNILSADFEYASKPNAIELMTAEYDKSLQGKNSSTSSFISLEHDSIPITVKEWTSIAIQKIKNLGYSFVTVGECLGDADRSNWYRD